MRYISLFLGCCMIFLCCGRVWGSTGDVGSGNTDTGSLVNQSPPDIIITEVYFEGDGERIELTNIGNDGFVGELTIRGAARSNAVDPDFIFSSIRIDAGQAIVIAETDKYPNYFSDQSVIVADYNDIVIKDDGTIDITLLFSGSEIDTFDIDKTLVTPYIDADRSFEKVYKDGQRIITITSGGRITNISNDFIANPGTYFTITTEEEIIDITDADGNDDGNEENNDPDQTDNTSSGNDNNDTCDSRTTGAVTISEVYVGDETHESYIELYFYADYDGTITLSGDGLLSGYVIDIIGEKHQYGLLLHTNSQDYPNHITFSHDRYGINQTGGQILIYGHNGQVLDKVDISVYSDGQANYVSTVTNCVREFDTTHTFSPGFDETLLAYFPAGVPTVVTKEVFIGGGGSCPAVTKDTEDEENNGGGDSDISTLIPSNHKTVPQSWVCHAPVTIEHIDYNPDGADRNNEVITLRSFFDHPVQLEGYHLALSTRSSKTTINGTLLPQTTQPFKGNFRFPNGGACVTLMSGTIEMDTYCYGDAKKKVDTRNQEGSTKNGAGDVEETTGEDNQGKKSSTTEAESGQKDFYQKTGAYVVPQSLPTISITNVLYDPPGSDTDREMITFRLLSGNNVNLDDYYLTINTRNRYLRSGLTLKTGLSVTGTFGFTNSKKTCVSLFHEDHDHIFDTYCYDPTKKESNEVQEQNGKKKDGEIVDPRLSYIIKIKEIIFDPLGNDTDRESITLQIVSGAVLDMEDLRLRVGSSNRIVKGTLYTGGVQTFVDNYRFPNDGACVALFLDDHVYDTLCYKPVQAESNKIQKQSDTDSAQQENTYIPDIVITDIIYDPLGDDRGHEQISFNILSSGDVDLSDKYSLFINGNRRWLTDFGILSGGQQNVLTGNFLLPNSKDACVELFTHDILLHTYCYMVSSTTDNTVKDTYDTGHMVDVEEIIPVKLPEINIVSVVPNPLGNDTDRETITLQLISPARVDLSGNYSLRIGNRRTSLVGLLTSGEQTTLTGNYRFPNRAECVQLEYGETVIDTFCYALPEDGIRFIRSATGIQALSTIDLSVLTDAKLTTIGDSMCITYAENPISCRRIPSGKLATQQMQELRMYRNYVSTLHSYLATEWSILFYNSPVQHLVYLYDDARDRIRDGQYYAEDTAMYDIRTRFAQQQALPMTTWLQQTFTHLLFPSVWQEYYTNIKDTYFRTLTYLDSG